LSSIPVDAGTVLMHADNRRVDYLQSGIMGARILSFMIQADIPQTKIILAKSSPGVAEADYLCGAPVISVTDGKAGLVYQHAQ
jgi:hypothetical protein